MVLELLLDPKKMVDHPIRIFLVGFVYSLVAVLLSFWIFEGYVSIIMVTLITIAVMPFFHSLIKAEEKKDLKFKSEFKLLKEHSKTIMTLLWLFIGFLAAFLLLAVFLPSGYFEKVFSTQIDTILVVRSSATGNFFGIFGTVSSIFFNNIQVLFFCVVFSLFYGAGAILILAWNASVMAAAIGAFIRDQVTTHSGSLFGYVNLTSTALLKYTFHGIPEIAAYFIGALAGGMIAFAWVNHDLKGKKFKQIVKDSLNLTLIAIVILFIASLLEVFVTPLLV
ncbi:MAG: stage II sporulation protein M [Nanoarchaeota archaeon]|nr:stage II sporulation protein M [Nanoarchaeota archaeon]